jgi:hypothetical protein
MSGQDYDACLGFPLRFVEAISRSCFSLIDSTIDFEAPFSSLLLLSPRLAASAAPAAICWALDFAGMASFSDLCATTTARCCL